MDPEIFETFKDINNFTFDEIQDKWNKLWEETERARNQVEDKKRVIKNLDELVEKLMRQINSKC